MAKILKILLYPIAIILIIITLKGCIQALMGSPSSVPSPSVSDPDQQKKVPDPIILPQAHVVDGVSQQQIISRMAKSAGDVNARGQVVLEDGTIFIGASTEGLIFAFQYQIPGWTKKFDDREIQYEIGVLKPTLIQKACSTGAVRFYINHGVTVAYSYFDANMRHRGVVEVVEANCLAMERTR